LTPDKCKGVAMPADNSGDMLLEMIVSLMAELHPRAVRHQDITLDSALDRDLGLDSLARMELLSRLEEAFGGHFPEKVMATAETPRDLLRHLGRRLPTPAETILFKDKMPVERDTSGRRGVRLSGVRSLLEVLERQVDLHPGKVHITLLAEEGPQRISYGRLHVESLKAAARLRAMQLEPGQTVAIMLPTGADYFFCFMGILYCGAIPLPLYPPARPSQIEEHIRRHRKIMANAEAAILVTVPAVKAVGRLLKSQVPELRKIVTVDDLYAERPEPIAPRQTLNDTAFLQYTSGSTGDPKGVILSHGNLLTNIDIMGRVCRVTPADVFVSWLPLYHDMGLIGAWFGSLCHGCRLVVMSPLSFLARPQRWLQAIHQYAGTISASPNFGYEICATRLRDSDLEGLDLHTWRLALNGAETVVPDTLRRFIRRFQPYGFDAKALTPVYGLAETTLGLGFPELGRGIRIDRIRRDTFTATGKADAAGAEGPEALEFVGCGKPLPGHQIRIVDSRGRELPEREEGQLQFTGPSSSSGYYRNPEQTRKLFDGKWLNTGDLAYIAAGEVYLTGRKKDVIIRGGRNIYPHELEEVVGNIEGIRKGCTAAFAAHQRDGPSERLVVLTESRMTGDKDLARLQKEIKAVTVDLLGLAPDDIVIGAPGTVLKTSSGKIRRSACRQLYESGHLGAKRAAVWLQLVKMGVAGVRPTLRRTIRNVAALLYAGYVWLVVALFIIPVWCAVMVSPAGERCWRLVAAAVRTICWLSGIRVRTHGAENLPAHEPYILVANHMSYIDSILLTAVLPEPCNFVAKAELVRNPLLYPALRKIEIFPVHRFDAEQGVADARKISAGTRRGARPLFFAEGTLQRMPGLLPFQMGAFVLASEEQLPVVPVTIQGTRNILRGGSWFPRRGRVRVDIGRVCRPGEPGWQGAIELRDRVRQTILARLGEPDLAGEFTSLRQMDIALPGKPSG